MRLTTGTIFLLTFAAVAATLLLLQSDATNSRVVSPARVEVLLAERNRSPKAPPSVNVPNHPSDAEIAQVVSPDVDNTTPKSASSQIELMLKLPDWYTKAALIRVVAHLTDPDGKPKPYPLRAGKNPELAPVQVLSANSSPDQPGSVTLDVPIGGLSLIIGGDTMWPLVVELRRGPQGVTWWDWESLIGTGDGTVPYVPQLTGRYTLQRDLDRGIRAPAMCGPVAVPESDQAVVELLPTTLVVPRLLDSRGLEILAEDREFHLEWFWPRGGDSRSRSRGRVRAPGISSDTGFRGWEVPHGVGCSVEAQLNGWIPEVLQQKTYVSAVGLVCYADITLEDAIAIPIRVQDYSGAPLPFAIGTCTLSSVPEGSYVNATHLISLEPRHGDFVYITALNYGSERLVIPPQADSASVLVVTLVRGMPSLRVEIEYSDSSPPVEPIHLRVKPGRVEPVEDPETGIVQYLMPPRESWLVPMPSPFSMEFSSGAASDLLNLELFNPVPVSNDFAFEYHGASVSGSHRILRYSAHRLTELELLADLEFAKDDPLAASGRATVYACLVASAQASANGQRSGIVRVTGSRGQAVESHFISLTVGVARSVWLSAGDWMIVVHNHRTGMGCTQQVTTTFGAPKRAILRPQSKFGVIKYQVIDRSGLLGQMAVVHPGAVSHRQGVSSIRAPESPRNTGRPVTPDILSHDGWTIDGGTVSLPSWVTGTVPVYSDGPHRVTAGTICQVTKLLTIATASWAGDLEIEAIAPHAGVSTTNLIDFNARQCFVLLCPSQSIGSDSDVLLVAGRWGESAWLEKGVANFTSLPAGHYTIQLGHYEADTGPTAGRSSAFDFRPPKAVLSRTVAVEILPNRSVTIQVPAIRE